MHLTGVPIVTAGRFVHPGPVNVQDVTEAAQLIRVCHVINLRRVYATLFLGSEAAQQQVSQALNLSATGNAQDITAKVAATDDGKSCSACHFPMSLANSPVTALQCHSTAVSQYFSVR